VKNIVILFLLLLLIGCSTLDTKPFVDFSSAVKSASDGADKILAINYEWEKENFIYDVAIGEEDVYSIFLEEPNNTKLDFSDAPFFYSLADVRDTLYDVNQATIKYIELLIILAEGSIDNREDFSGYAKSLDNDMNSMISRLNLKVPGEIIPAFSLIVTELVNMLMQEKRKAAIMTVLDGNQVVIESYTRKCVQLIEITRNSLYHSYSKYFANAEEELFILDDIEKRKKLARNILEFNEEYIAIINALNTTKKIYNTLPKAHKALYKSINKRRVNLQYVLDLQRYASDLERNYKELKND
jgi:hypothetical protein